MRLLATIAIAIAPFTYGLAQQAPAADGTPPSKQDAAAQETASSPVPIAESWLTGWIELGYRARTDVGGSFDTYRTFVDLGSGPKLLSTEFTLADPKRRLFDWIRVRAYGLGGEPYQTLHLDAEKSNLYRFTADYRDIVYFDVLPSYADPVLSRGIILNEQAFDTHRKMASFQLDLRPASRIIPYIVYERNSGSGAGVTAFFTDTNQFPVPSRLRESTDLYRGGIRIELRRFHATLEQGGTTFKDDESVLQNPGGTNSGNVLTPVLGRTTDLTSLLAAYGIRGNSIYTKALFTAEPASWLDFYGQFLYSQPRTDANYQQKATGDFLQLNPSLFYTGQAYLLSSAAKLPHTTASFGAEARPISRVRVVTNWLTDRLHNADSAASAQVFANSTASGQSAALLESALVNNYNQAEVNILLDATRKLMLRGGYRRVWGDVNEAVLPPAGLVNADQAKLKRNVGLGGVRYHPIQNLSLMAEAEAGSSSATYFRTALYNYQRVRAQARYQTAKSLAVTADFSALLNNNPATGVKSDYRAQQESLSLFWTPGKVWNLQGSYSRSTVYSDINYLDPGTLRAQPSLYRENAHTVTALINLTPPSRFGIAPRITLGGSFFLSSGSRPSSYYQPTASVRLPLARHLSWFAEWRYYGYGESFQLYEGFRTHLVTTGLRLTR